MKVLIFLLGVLITPWACAQTGPGGVGNSTSTGLWLKADAGTSTTVNLAAVSTWSDVSGNSNHATQPTSNRQPLYTPGLINNMPALFFDNIGSPGNDFLSVADANNLDQTGGMTILSVTRPISLDNSSARSIVSKRVDANNQEAYCIFFYTNNHIEVDIENNSNRFATPFTFAAGRDYVTSLWFNGSLTAGNRVRVYINEALDITAAESSTFINNSSAPVTIGTMNTNDGRPFGGYIAEVIIFIKTLNDVERIIAHNYLFAKYGLSNLSSPATLNDIYTGDDAANGHYDFEVAGVGTDVSGSNATVSSSVTGGMAMTQVSGFDNGDYILYGHPAGSNNSQITDVGGMTGTNNARWSRIWFLDITNTSTTEAVNISFDMSDAGTPATPANASNYVLLRRAGQSGNWTEVTTASSIAGDAVNFDNISIAADEYYTIGTRNYITSPLPVSLIDFTARLTEKGVELKWSTATENNSDYFTIERSPDGDKFKTMTTVQGSGDSFNEVNYATHDREPFSNRTYYRLLQTDFDGRTTNLKTISVATSKPLGEIEVVPNPSKGNFWFDLPEGAVNYELKIMSSAGQQVPFNHSALGSRVFIDAQSLPKGFYILKVVSDSGMHAAKFIIE